MASAWQGLALPAAQHGTGGSVLGSQPGWALEALSPPSCTRPNARPVHSEDSDCTSRTEFRENSSGDRLVPFGLTSHFLTVFPDASLRWLRLTGIQAGRVGPSSTSQAPLTQDHRPQQQRRACGEPSPTRSPMTPASRKFFLMFSLPPSCLSVSSFPLILSKPEIGNSCSSSTVHTL